MPRPDGWSRLSNGTWTPPAPAQIQKQWEVPADVALTTIRDKAVEVRNADAEVVVRMGKLADGSYGLELLEGGLTINQLSGTTLVVKDDEGDTRVIVGEHEGDFDVKIFDEEGENPVKLSTLAFGLQAAEVLSLQSTTSSTYTDLATVGPTVTVDIGPLGRAVVAFSSFMSRTASPGESRHQGMSFAMSGANVLAASDQNSANLFLFNGALNADDIQIESQLTRHLVLTGLDEGSTTFTAKYRSDSTGNAATFDERFISVQPF